ncbi:S8 family serine peptidase [bacterium]|nr:S8 family serine peptidase [bacterium]
MPPLIQAPAYMSQEVIVQYRPEASFDDIGKTYSNFGLYEKSYSPYSGIRTVRVPSNYSVYSIAANLNQNPAVAYAEPNYIRRANFVPNDPLYKYQWHLNNQVMQQTWNLSLGTNIVVAVLDTGVAYRNGGGFAQAPDLTDTSFIPGYDFVNDDSYPDDDNRHGTHIAGIIAQSTNNLYGGSGVAPGCTLMPVKVLDKTGSGNVSDIVEAIYFAVNNGVNVINMSYGFVTSPSASEEEAINYAVSKGITVICSAGNEATNEPHYPSSYEAAISVTATRLDNTFAVSYSNYGHETDICAPGGDLDEDMNVDGYPDGIYQQTHNGVDFKEFDFYFAEGTSCSAAYVSGIVALMMSRANRPLTPSEVRQILQTTGTDLGEPGWDQFYGWGLVNPLAAVQAAVTYSAAGYFAPGIIVSQQLNTASVSAYTPYQTSTYSQNNTYNNIYNKTTSTAQVPAVGSTYQLNSGFAPIGQTIGAGIQTINNQSISPYQYQSQGILGQNSYAFLNLNPFSAGSLYTTYNSIAAIAPFLLNQNFFQWPQQQYSYGSSYTTPAASYQTEAAFSQTFLPYQTQAWNDPVTAPSTLTFIPNALFFLRWPF